MTKKLELSYPIAAFIQATNNHDTSLFLATLAGDAVVTDENKDYRGIAAIKEWSDEKYIGAGVTLDPLDATDRDGNTTVTVKVDGSFDKTGLPDPFLMDFHFTIEDTKIAALSIRLAKQLNFNN